MCDHRVSSIYTHTTGSIEFLEVFLKYLTMRTADAMQLVTMQVTRNKVNIDGLVSGYSLTLSSKEVDFSTDRFTLNWNTSFLLSFCTNPLLSYAATRISSYFAPKCKMSRCSVVCCISSHAATEVSWNLVRPSTAYVSFACDIVQEITTPFFVTLGSASLSSPPFCGNTDEETILASVAVVELDVDVSCMNLQACWHPSSCKTKQTTINFGFTAEKLSFKHLENLWFIDKSDWNLFISCHSKRSRCYV